MASNETLIGHITQVEGASLTAAINAGGEGAFPVVELDGERIRVGQIGSYVAIHQDDVRVLGMVISAAREEANGSGDGGRLLTMIPLGTINDEGVFERGVATFPSPGAEVHVVGEDEIRSLFARYYDKGFTVGYLPSRPTLEVSLEPAKFFGRHFAILGQSGAGKSWTVASLIQRTVQVMPNAHVILLDLHGEYCWKDNTGALQSAFDPNIYRYIDARELEIPYWLLTYSELVDLLIDKEDKEASTQIAFLRDVVHSLRKKENRHLDLPKISIDSPVYFSLVDLYRHFKHANEYTTDFGKKKGPLFGKFDSFLIKLQSRFNDIRYDFLLKPKHRKSSETLTDLLRDFVGLGEPRRQLTVIDLSSVPFDVRPTVSAQIGRLAFEFNYWNPHYREFPILLVCEEAHSYIPRAGTGHTQYEATRRAMERIAKEGRKYGVALGVVSQRPHELSETVLAQCGNFLCLRITNPDDQEYVRDLVPDAERDLIDTLSALGRGECLALGESIPVPTRFQVFRPSPTPNSEDTDFYSFWKGGPEDLDVDDIVARWRRQERQDRSAAKPVSAVEPADEPPARAESGL
jgi:DNA helicase HerA-like ATPase